MISYVSPEGSIPAAVVPFNQPEDFLVARSQQEVSVAFVGAPFQEVLVRIDTSELAEQYLRVSDRR